MGDTGEELLAMWDVENDVGILESAGVELPMGNRGEGVKGVNDYVVEEGNDRGGVGVALDLLVLGSDGGVGLEYGCRGWV